MNPPQNWLSWARGRKLLASLLLSSVQSQAAVWIGIDLTVDPFDPPRIVDEVSAHVDRVGANGEKIMVVAITGRTLTDPIVFWQSSLPEKPGIKNKDRKDTLEKLRAKLRQGLENKNTYPKALFDQSRIADFFKLPATATLQDEQQLKLAIWSDMLEVHSPVDWEHGQIAAKDIAIPRLTGTVAIFGVRSSKYKDSVMWDKVRGIWVTTLKEAGLKTTVYSSIQ